MEYISLYVLNVLKHIVINIQHFFLKFSNQQKELSFIKTVNRLGEQIKIIFSFICKP